MRFAYGFHDPAHSQSPIRQHHIMDLSIILGVETPIGGPDRSVTLALVRPQRNSVILEIHDAKNNDS